MTAGRKRRSVFHFLTHPVKQKLQNRNNKVLSKAGKFTLLKTVAQTIPNFWMNLFLLPNDVCEGIEKQMNGFWWENGAESKGIRWMSWDKLCITKEGVDWV